MSGFTCDDKSTSGRKPSVFHIERNAWRRAQCTRAGVLVDASAYFAFLDLVLRQARQQILVLGWDFDGDIRLCPGEQDTRTLGDRLLDLVEERPQLQIYILVWVMGPIYSGKKLKPFSPPWARHPQIHLQFESHASILGSLHQKLVCIDDCIGFAGGIDLTARRWDTPEHAPINPLRQDPAGVAYEPVHDVQIAVEGDVACAIGDICRTAWYRATGEHLSRCIDAPLAWPGAFPPLLSGCDAVLARTETGQDGQSAHVEAVALTLDILASARRYIYIEAQYFASETVTDVLCRQLAAAEGPEIVVIATRHSHGTIERLIMGENRNRMLRRLRKADAHGRLRLGYPVVPKADEDVQEVVVHSKLVIADGRYLKIGSSNMNQRSQGFDTECDIAVEADGAAASASIDALRDRLLCEHLGAEPEQFATELQSTGSLVRTFDRFNVNRRHVHPFDHIEDDGPETLVTGTSVFDPPRLPVFYRWFFAAKRALAALFSPSTGSSSRSSTPPRARQMSANGSGRKK